MLRGVELEFTSPAALGLDLHDRTLVERLFAVQQQLGDLFAGCRVLPFSDGSPSPQLDGVQLVMHAQAQAAARSEQTEEPCHFGGF